MQYVFAITLEEVDVGQTAVQIIAEATDYSGAIAAAFTAVEKEQAVRKETKPQAQIGALLLKGLQRADAPVNYICPDPHEVKAEPIR